MIVVARRIALSHATWRLNKRFGANPYSGAHLHFTVESLRWSLISKSYLQGRAKPNIGRNVKDVVRGLHINGYFHVTDMT